MDNSIAAIRKGIEMQIDRGNRRFVIFPYGDLGMQVKTILNNVYGIQEEYIIDNHLCKYNLQIKSIDCLKTVDCKDLVVILASVSDYFYEDLKNMITPYFKEEQIVDFYKKNGVAEEYQTKVGKYSSGALCKHYLVESVGSFCSFAEGVDVVLNHPTNYITTHSLIYQEKIKLESGYDAAGRDGKPCMEGIKPRGVVKSRRITIGNDVWLGKNVIIANGANIGNGVIAGAGAVIIKDVPDYAVVVGVPARIIRYRYNPEQIAALNRIQWWNWTDDEIRANYDDLYLPIDEFIAKYDR